MKHPSVDSDWTVIHSQDVRKVGSTPYTFIYANQENGVYPSLTVWVILLFT